MQLCEVQVSYKPKNANKPKVADSESAYMLHSLVFNMDTIAYQEQFVVLFLNRNCRVIGYSQIAIGTAALVPVDIKMIAQRAILSHAENVILMHNHPSGEIKPSQQDEQLTRRVKEALRLFDIKVLDHVIVSGDEYACGSDRYYSFNDNGLI